MATLKFTVPDVHRVIGGLALIGYEGQVAMRIADGVMTLVAQDNEMSPRIAARAVIPVLHKLAVSIVVDGRPAIAAARRRRRRNENNEADITIKGDEVVVSTLWDDITLPAIEGSDFMLFRWVDDLFSETLLHAKFAEANVEVDEGRLKRVMSAVAVVGGVPTVARGRVWGFDVWNYDKGEPSVIVRTVAGNALVGFLVK